MTEEEAKTKWCPLVRYLAIFKNDEGRRETAGSFNRGSADSSLPKCIGSECMAWRWDAAKMVDGEYPTSPRKVVMQGGHCGAFGRPAPIDTWQVANG